MPEQRQSRNTRPSMPGVKLTADKIVTRIAHDVSAHVGRIIGAAELADRFAEKDLSRDGHRLSECIADIHQSAQFAQLLLRTCSIVTAEQLYIRRGTGRLSSDVLLPALHWIRSFGPANTDRLKIEMGAPAKSLSISGDLDLLRHAFYYFFLHAVTQFSHLTGHGDQRIGIGTDETTKLLRVKCSLLGLRMEAFVQSSSGSGGSSSDNWEGLGLCAAAKVIEAHKGTVSIAEQGELSTIVIFELPRSKATDA